MHKPTGSEDARPMAQATTMAVLVQPSASTVGEAVRLALEAAGLQSIVVPTVFDAVVEIERAAGAVRYLAASVDYFGPQEFRLLPLVRREWPETILIASHSPGFNYKGRLAELVGADVILGSLDDVSRFAAGLPKAATEAAAAAPTPAEPPRWQTPEVAQSVAALPKSVREPAPATRPAEASAPVAAPSPEPMNPVLAGVLAAVHEEPVPVEEAPSAPAPERKPPPMTAFTSTAAPAPPSAAATVATAAAKPATAPESAGKAGKSAPPRPAGKPPVNAGKARADAGKAPVDDLEDAEVIGTIELTEEELRLLLGEEEGA
jgi:hypothetical protein